MLGVGLLDNQAFQLFVKVGILSLFVFYIIFAFVIVKQVNKMTDTLEVGFETPLRLFAVLHLLLSLSVFLLGLVIL